MRRPIDVLFFKALRRAHRATASEAAGTAIALAGATSKRPVLVVLDVGFVSGTTPLMDGGIDGSDDAFTNTEPLATFVQVSAAVAQFFSVAARRGYRARLTTISGTSPVFDYGLYVVGFLGDTNYTPAI
jgi:hypothetical protein